MYGLPTELSTSVGLPEAAQNRLRETEREREVPDAAQVSSDCKFQLAAASATSGTKPNFAYVALSATTSPIICCYSENAERHFSRCEAAVLTLQSSVAYTYDQQQRLCGLSAAEHRASRPETRPTENQYSGLQALLILARQQYGITWSKTQPTVHTSTQNQIWSTTQQEHKHWHEQWMGEPVWPSGKPLLRLVSGRTSVRYRFGSPFSSERLWFVDTGLVTLSITSHWNIKIAFVLTDAGIILVVTV